MAYTVLARRYRSQTFDDVVGQAHVAQTLKKAITSGRIAHAYLFSGTRGTGKTSMARIFAKALNCLSFPEPTPTPCGTCSSCLGIARGEDMDYVEIDAASNTQVDKTREAIIGNIAYRPALCRFKIFLIDEVHMLSKASFNALLKTLEEPPEHVKFLLATTEPEKLPATILSRVQRYDFRNIPVREVAGHLRSVCEKEGIEAQEDALTMVARAGAGSMRDSLSLLDRLLSVGEKTLTVANIEQLLGLPPGERIATLVDALGEGDANGALRQADEILAAGMSPDALIAGLVDHLHNLLLLRVSGGKTDLAEVPGVPMETLQAQARKLDAVVLTQDIALLEELKRQLRQGAGGRALLDATLVRLALAEQFRSITSLLEGGTAEAPAPAEQKKKPELPELTAAPEPPSPPPQPAQAPQLATRNPQLPDDDDLPRPGKVWDNAGPSLKELLAAQAGKPEPAPAPVPAAAPTDLPRIWQNVLEQFRSTQALFGQLSHSWLMSIDDGRATIGVTSELFARQLERGEKRDRLTAALAQTLGQSIGLQVVLDAPAAAAIPAPTPERPRAARPTLKEIKDLAQTAPPLVPQPAAAPAIPIDEALMSELREDDLARAVLEGLGAQVIRVTEE